MFNEVAARALGGVIRARRRELAQTQAALAKAARVSDAYVSQIEHGVRHPSEDVLARLSESLETTADDLRSRAAAAVGERTTSTLRPDWLDAGELDRILSDPDQIQVIAIAAGEQLATIVDEFPATIHHRGHVMVRLALSYAAGTYRACDRTTVVVIVAALLYLASADDLIPDFHPDGLRDDAAVIAFASTVAARALADFDAWENH